MTESDHDALVARAAGLQRQGEDAAARAICDFVLADAPGHANALVLAGILAGRRGEIDAALAFMASAARAAPQSAEPHLHLAELLRMRRRLDPAAAAAQQATMLAPGSAATWFVLARIMAEKDDLAAARVGYERALACDPGFRTARVNLAAVLAVLGAWDEARAAYAVLFAEGQESAELLANHAALLVEIGEYAQAFEQAERAIALDPGMAQARLVRGFLLGRRRRFAEALEETGLACELLPHSVQAGSIHAGLLVEAERWDEAVACTETLAARLPGDGLATELHARTLQAAGREAEAIDAFERAAATLADPGAVLANHGVLLMEAGRLDEATACFDAAITHRPALAAAWYNRAQIKLHAPDDPDIVGMAALAAAPATSFSERMYLHFALGKAHEEAGNPAAAFGHWETGNRMKRSLVEHDLAATAGRFDALVRLAAALPVPEPQRPAVQPGPIFVVGMPRSGTSLVEQILASHPRVVGAGELTALGRVVEAALARGGSPDWQEEGEAYLAVLRSRHSGGERVVDKMPTNFRYLGFMPAMLPGVRIIHCRRDPLDTCLSCYSKLFRGEMDFSYDLRELGRYHRDYRRLMAAWRDMLPPGAMIEIDYETLVAAPAAEIRRLLDFLELGWDARCLAFHQTRRSVRTASFVQVRQPIYTTAVGRARAFRDYLGPLIEALGPTDPSAAG